MRKSRVKGFVCSNTAEMSNEDERLKYYSVEKYFFLSFTARLTPGLVSGLKSTGSPSESIPSVCKRCRRRLYRIRALIRREAKCHKNAELLDRQRHEVAINTKDD